MTSQRENGPIKPAVCKPFASVWQDVFSIFIKAPHICHFLKTGPQDKNHFCEKCKCCLHPLKNPPSVNSFTPNSSGPMPTSATPLALMSGSSLLISDAVHRHTWQPNLRRKNKTTGWSCHRDWSSTLWNTNREILLMNFFKCQFICWLLSHWHKYSDPLVSAQLMHWFPPDPSSSVSNISKQDLCCSSLVFGHLFYQGPSPTVCLLCNVSYRQVCVFPNHPINVICHRWTPIKV